MAELPERLPATPRFVWQKRLNDQGLAGVAANSRYVLVVDRELAGTTDVFRCLKADTGENVWALRYPAQGELDYGASPRATPLIQGESAFLLGAFGHLHCVELASGKIIWKKDLRAEFAVEEKLVWGVSSSPLVVDGKLLINPGAKQASLAALDPKTGAVTWKTPGAPAAFGSFIVGQFGGKRQLVGYDKESLGGWEIATGERLWKLVPPNPNDFNVPTPIQYGDQLVVSSENNGTRLYRFQSDGKIVSKPAAENLALAPDTHTPVVIGDRLFGEWSGLYCLDLKNGLKAIWKHDDPAFNHYASIIGSRERLLITSQQGELLLVDAQADSCRILSRLRLFDEESGVYSHPALVGPRLYLRSSAEVSCIDLRP